MLAAEQQIPFHLLLPVAVRLYPVRGELTVQQERQRQRKHLGLAGPVVAPEQQPAVVEPELLGVVVEHVDQARAQRLPPVRTGRWQHRLVPFSSPGWSAGPGRSARSPADCGPPARPAQRGGAPPASPARWPAAPFPRLAPSRPCASRWHARRPPAARKRAARRAWPAPASRGTPPQAT